MSAIIRLLLVIAAGGTWWLIAGIQPSPAAAAERHLLWQSRDQFVALEPQDAEKTGPASPNDHPAALTDAQLATLLSPLLVQPAGSAASEPLFTLKTLETLTPHLILGLRKAAPGEDVTFAVIGLHDALHGLTKEPRVTTGRLFVRSGRLNLIIGLAQRDVNEREDRRLAPFTPGSRKAAAAGEWLLHVPAEPGGYTMVRRDWVSVATGWQPPPSADSPPTAPAKQVPAGPNRREQARTPAERLTTLNELKSMGLITDEEYRNKRLQILNDL